VYWPVASPDRPHWEEVVPHRADVMLEGVELFARHRVLVERTQGLPVFRVTSFASGDEHTVAFPEPTYTAFPGTNAEFDTSVFRYAYESLVKAKNPSHRQYDPECISCHVVGFGYKTGFTDEVKTPNGGTRYKAAPKKTRVFPKDVMADATYALQQVVRSGTGTEAEKLGRPAANA